MSVLNNQTGAKQMKKHSKLQIIYKHGQPEGIRDDGGYLFMFPSVCEHTGQRERYMRELKERYDLADYLLSALSEKGK